MKAVMWIAGLVVLLVAGVGAYIVLNSGSLIKTAVETLGPEYLGVPVRLGSAEVSLMDGSGELRDLVIGNPEGFAGPHAMSIGRIALTLDPAQISQELVVIKSLVIDSADVVIVAKGTDTNLQAIMDKLSEEEDSAPAEDSSAEMKMIIDEFVFSNARTSFDSDIIGSKSVELPDIRLSGIGRKTNGATARETITQLFRPIARGSAEAVVNAGLNVDEIKKSLTEKTGDAVGRGISDLRKRLEN